MNTTTHKLKRTKKKPGTSAQSRPVESVLVESFEFEWVTPLNLPGLISVPTAVQPEAASTKEPNFSLNGDVIESEDGDIVSACQLPGRLINVAS